MSENPVLESTKFLIENPKYVNINFDVLKKVAKKFSQENFTIAEQKFPIYPQKNNREAIDFLLLAASINFAFTDFKSKMKFKKNYKGTSWRGYFGMMACLKKAFDTGKPLAEGEYLRKISKNEMRELFSGNIEIPMLNERWNIFREVGKVLYNKYNGHFYNLAEVSGNRLFNNGEGMVERLVSDFPSFDDSWEHGRKKAIFNKRAQLVCATLYLNFNGQKPFRFEDINKLTVFADYVLPKGLRDLGIISYNDSLAKRIDKQKLIEAGSREELEIRAATVHAADLLIKEINKYRNNDKINALHLDFKLWSESRVTKGYHHLTKTIAY